MNEPQSLAEYIRELEDQVDHYQQMNKQAVDQLKHAAEVINRLREELNEIRKSQYTDLEEEDLPSLLRKQAN